MTTKLSELSGTEHVTDETIARLAGISARRVRQLAEAGILKRASRGRYELAPTIRALLDEAADQASPLQRARTRLVEAQADIAEAEAAEKVGEVVGVTYLHEQLSDLFVVIRTNLRNIPNRLCSVIVGEMSEAKIKAVMLREIDECLVALSETIIQQGETNHEQN